MDAFGISAISDVLGKVIDRVWPNKADADAAKLELFKMQQTGELAQLTAETQLAQGQIDINKAEATNDSVFVSGARPFILWVCGISLAYVSLVEPAMRFVAEVGYKYTGAFPVIDTSLTFQLMFGMLGLGAMRSFDKVKGVATK